MAIASGGGKEMLGPMNMQASQHGRAPGGTGWPSPYHWERRTGRNVRMAQPGCWRPPRQMDSWFEEQLRAYPQEASLHLGEWHPPLQACGRCQHKEEATSRFWCAFHQERRRAAARAVGGHWRIPDGEVLLVVSNLPGSWTCLGERGWGTYDWAVDSWGQ